MLYTTFPVLDRVRGDTGQKKQRPWIEHGTSRFAISHSTAELPLQFGENQNFNSVSEGFRSLLNSKVSLISERMRERGIHFRKTSISSISFFPFHAMVNPDGFKIKKRSISSESRNRIGKRGGERAERKRRKRDRKSVEGSGEDSDLGISTD